MSSRLHVGVIGLGRRWERYRPALTGRDSLLDVGAVCDPSSRQTRRVARDLRCEGAEAAEDLFDRPDLDALLLLDAPWHGLWSLERACEAGKPVFCAAPVTCDDGHAKDLQRKLQERPLPTMTAMASDVLPAVLRLRVLLDKHLGPARRVRITGNIGRHVTDEKLFDSGAWSSAVHLCSELLEGTPGIVWAACPAGSGMANVTFAYPNGCAALISITVGDGAGWRVAVTAEKGSAVVALPRRLSWKDSGGEHVLRLPPQDPRLDLLRRFADSVRTGRQPRPSFDDACRALTWLRAVRRSHTENRPVAVAGESGS
jgi:predicted dehydrogenase